MHKVSIPKNVVRRVMDRRGTAHVHAGLDPATTALVVVDLQNGFMVEEHAIAYVPRAVDIVPNVNRLATAVRETGGKVFWIKHTVDETAERDWWRWFAMSAGRPQQNQRRRDKMAIDAIGHQLHPDLVVKPEDETVLKRRFSAFIQGASNLPERLQAGGFETVLIVGTLTNVCCESSARDAMMLNYDVVMVSDANAALSDEEHNATLVSIYASFGDVMDTETLVGCLHQNCHRQAAE